MWKLFFLSCFFVAAVNAEDFYYINQGKRVELTPVTNEKSVPFHATSKMATFKDSKGKKLEIGNRLIVQFKTTDRLSDYLNLYSLRVIKRYSFKNMFLLEASDVQSAINVANSLSEMSDVVFAQPDIIKKRTIR
ncbi:hypothetical protein [Hydrogenimonas sp.]